MFEDAVAAYKHDRDFPAKEGTSRLSPHLHFGEISPATIWHRLAPLGAHGFLRELAWRDFAQQMMLEYPDLGTRNGSPLLDRINYRSGSAADRDLEAWQQGRTGISIVDAGMRQLWATGWMHNRVRMLTATYLTKHLLIDWREGARWSWDTLVDTDYDNNSLNWQWIAGTGPAAAPFYRIMNPLLQSEKFDAAAYIRRWVPELRSVPDEIIHDPGVFAQESGYPLPVVAHREGRERALSAWNAMKAGDDA